MYTTTDQFIAEFGTTQAVKAKVDRIISVHQSVSKGIKEQIGITVDQPICVRLEHIHVYDVDANWSIQDNERCTN